MELWGTGPDRISPRTHWKGSVVTLAVRAASKPAHAMTAPFHGSASNKSTYQPHVSVHLRRHGDERFALSSSSFYGVYDLPIHGNRDATVSTGCVVRTVGIGLVPA